MRVYRRQMKRELRLQRREPQAILNGLLFFIMLSLFFPLTLAPHSPSLKDVFPGLIWLAALFKFLLSSQRLFAQDFSDGVTEQWLASGHSLPGLVSIKILCSWFFSLGPLLLYTPILALVFSLSWQEFFILNLSLLLGTPALQSLCALSSAFSLAVQDKGFLMAVIILPLALPVLIFGSLILALGSLNTEFWAYLAILMAISLVTLSFLPFAIAALLKISLSD